MKKIIHSAILPFTNQQVYDLVNDIESYPLFLPWCRAAKIHDKTECEIQASLTVAKGAFEKTFETRNYIVANESMKLILVDGPFKHFEGAWLFEAVDEGKHCKVIYSMEFEFSNRLLGMFAEPIFSQIADTMINAFQKRAEELYLCK